MLNLERAWVLLPKPSFVQRAKINEVLKLVVAIVVGRSSDWPETGRRAMIFLNCSEERGSALFNQRRILLLVLATMMLSVHMDEKGSENIFGCFLYDSFDLLELLGCWYSHSQAVGASGKHCGFGPLESRAAPT